ncbi:MAG: prephenate dehydratase [Spirulinaceae cyanobacterium SM2_1_0]|nr:prephenate dehydratase [Spirulinaceae cyanobacterium SM2_1_0]
MSLIIAYLGPEGTYAESVALAYAQWLRVQGEAVDTLVPYASIPATLRAVSAGEATLAVVPIENSIHGSVAISLDTLWQLELPIRQALVLPICHSLLSHAPALTAIATVYSHPQALAQCQGWLERHLPQAQLVAANSTTAVLRELAEETTAAAIASPRAAALYQVPVLAANLNDYPENHTRFWVTGGAAVTADPGDLVSLAFSVPANVPGALVAPLQVFATRGINLSRIESRPTKRSLGEYLFFVDLAGCLNTPAMQSAITELAQHTEVLKIFGSYRVLNIRDGAIAVDATAPKVR